MQEKEEDVEVLERLQKELKKLNGVHEKDAIEEIEDQREKEEVLQIHLLKEESTHINDNFRNNGKS